MKVCPACKQTYADESLNFCLSDGSVLIQSSSGQSGAGYISPETLVMPGALPTSGQQNQPVTVPSWQQTPSYPPPSTANGSYKWVAGILVSLILLGGIGIVGLIGLVSIYGDNSNTNPGNSSNSSRPSFNTPRNDSNVLINDDLSGWQRTENAFGKTSYEDGEFVMNSKGSAYYYVLVTGNKEFITSNTTTRVTLRNTTGKESALGYGLVINSDQKQALKKDYAFLIDTVKKSYRIVQHADTKETEIKSWTPFNAIRSGTETNEIKVSDEDGILTLYINGQSATTVTAKGEYKEGVAGLYVGDAIPIAFSNLELIK